MLISRIPLSFLQAWKTVKQVFSKGANFPTPTLTPTQTTIEQCGPPEKDTQRQSSMHHTYRYW